MSEPRIFVATPLGKNGMLHIGTASYCASVQAFPNVDWGYTQTHTAEMSRNSIIERHLLDNPDTTHFLFLDSDVVPPYGALQRMLSFEEDIVTGPTPIYFNEQLKWNVTVPDTEMTWFRMSDPLPSEPFYTDKTGFGIVLVKREVLEAIGWPWFKTEYQEIGDTNVAMKTGEDVWFCRRAKEKGYKILVDPETQCKHYNQVDLMQVYNDVTKQIEERLLAVQDGYGTHWDVLSTVIMQTEGDVIELGCGNESTLKLSMLCRQLGKHLYTYENNKEWHAKFVDMQSDTHDVIYIEDYAKLPPTNAGVVFVDSAPIESRLPLCEKFIDWVDVMVIHDTEDMEYGVEKFILCCSSEYTDRREAIHTTAVSNTKTLDFLENIIPQEKVTVDGTND